MFKTGLRTLTYKSLPSSVLTIGRASAYRSGCLYTKRQLATCSSHLVPFLPKRHYSDEATNKNTETNTASAKIVPEYLIAFTCKKCNTRSSHTFSKQAYHHGTVLIQCPGCKNRHLIADHLKICDDKRITIEDILKQQGESVATQPQDIAFEDIPEKLKSTLGYYASDAPEEYKQENNGSNELPSPDAKKTE